MSSTELDRLVAENAELRRRVEIAQSTIQQLRQESLQRRSEVRALAEALPTAMSRHALIRQMLGDAVHHPDRMGVTRRAVRKLARAPHKAMRVVQRRT